MAKKTRKERLAEKGKEPPSVKFEQPKERSLKVDSLDGGLVWIDLEMNGLNVKENQIIEIACCVTDKDLKTIYYGPDVIVHLDNNCYKRTNPWCRNQFGGSDGLLTKARNSNISMKEAEDLVINFVSKFFTGTYKPLLAGASPSKDREFLENQMPNLNNMLCFRTIDVSTFKECLIRWSDFQIPKVESDHRAQADILRSISELKSIKNHLFPGNSETGAETKVSGFSRHFRSMISFSITNFIFVLLLVYVGIMFLQFHKL